MLNQVDPVEIFTANKIKYFHHKKKNREEKNSKKIRLVYIIINIYIFLFFF